MAYFFTSDHCRIYYEVHGSGEQTIVFINGGSCSYRYWYKQLPLAEKYRLVFADLRGHGNSDAPAWGYS
uniref:alpha/beta fold hydrolase n=1 Tax=uncultured Intestinimonas sp. TaxID=1689265 RepID=UPI0025F1A41E